MVTSFVLNTRSEFLKSRQTAAFWLTVIGAVFIPVVNFIKLVARPDHFVKGFKNDPWQIIINDNWQAATFFLLPMYVILVTSLVVQIEYKNNTWKQVYASPRTLTDIFFSRFIVIHSLILFCFIVFSASIVLASCAANLIQKQYTFFDHPVPWKGLFLLIAKTYYSVLAITAIQYWLSLRFKNFIIPVGIGLGLLITGFIVHQWEQLYFHPYMYPIIAFWPSFQKNTAFIFKAQVLDVSWFVIVLMMAFWDMTRRREKG
jgi:lantibiotic transport system permease protein